MIVYGDITNVYIAPSGTALVTDLAIGATSLAVADAYPFSSNGGTLTLNGIQMTYSSVDYELNLIAVPALALAAVADDEVLVYPLGSTKYAMIDPSDGDEGFRAIVPFTMVSLLDDGMREDFEKEQVLCDDETGRWEVKSIDDQIPTVVGSYVSPLGLPIASDGFAPASSPLPQILSGIGSIFITWSPIINAGVVTYDVYLYTVPGSALTAGNLLGSTEGAMLNTTKLPSGTALVNGTTYYAKVVARDADGAAAASAEASGGPIAGADPAVLAANVTQINTLNAKFPINTIDVATGAITTSKIGDGAVNAIKITDGTVTATKIAANTITAAQIAADAITATQIAPLTITAAQIANLTIGAGQITNGTITTAKIGAGQITGTTIADGAVTTAKVFAGAITANEIAAGAITAEKLTIGSVVRGLVMNGSFDSVTNGVPDGWALIENAGPVGVTTVSGSPSPGNVAYIGATGSGVLGAKAFRITSGRQYRIKFSNSHSNGNGTQTIHRVNYGPTIDAAGYVTTALRTAFTDLAYVSNSTLNGVWVGFEYIWTAPATGFASMTFINYTSTGILYIDEVTIDEVIISAQIADGAISANKILANTITAGQIAANTITASQIAASTITAMQIAGATITATQLAAGAVTANKLNVIMGGGNLYPNSSFEDATAALPGATGTTATWSTAFAYQGTRSLRLVGTTTNGDDYVTFGANIPVVPNKTYTATAWCYATSIIGGAVFNIGLFPVNAAGNSGLTGGYETTLTTSHPLNVWTRHVITFTTGASDTSIQLRLYSPNGTVYWDAVQVEEGDVPTAYAPKTSEILPGTIVASMIAANTITATQIAAGTITATQIAAGAITANKLSIIVGGGNLWDNSSFERDVVGFGTNPDIGWFGGFGARATMTYNTSSLYRGTRSLQVYHATNGDSTALVSPAIYAATGSKWVASFYVRITAGTQDPLAWGIGQPDQNYIITNPATVTATQLAARDAGAGWYRIATAFSVTAAGNLRPTLYNTNGTTANDTDFVVDCVQVEEGDIPTAYAPRGDEILPGTILAAMIVADTITGNEIAANSISTSELAALSVNAGKIVANTITAGQIAATTITATQIAATTITATQIAAGTVTATEIAGTTITAAKIAGGTITAAQIAAGTITATQIAAGAITTEKLTVGSLGDNLVLNPRFTDYTYNLGSLYYAGNKPNSWVGEEGSYYGGSNPNVNYPGGVALVVVRNSGGYGEVSSTPFPVVVGDYIAIRCKIGYVGSAPGAYFRLTFLNSVGATISDNDILNSDALVGFSGDAARKDVYGAIGPVPSGAVGAKIKFYNYPATGTDSYLLVNDVSAQVQTVGVQIADGAITAAKIIAGAIDGKTITGALIRTAASGTRIQMSSTSSDRIELYPAGAVTSPSSITVTGSNAWNQFQLTSGIPTGGPPYKPAIVTIQSQGPFIATTISASVKFQADFYSFQSITGGDIVPAADTVGGNVYMNAGLWTGASIHSGSLGIYMDDLSGGGNTTAQIATGGRIVRATLAAYTISSLALKANVEDMTFAEAFEVLKLRARTYQDKKLTGPKHPRLPGFIAEEADEAGLELWVGRDENDEVEGFRYAHLTSAHNMLIKDLYDEVAKLKALLHPNRKASK